MMCQQPCCHLSVLRPTPPQIFCLFLFLFAASLFGTIVAQVNEIVAQLTTKKKDLDFILEAYLVIHPRWVPTLVLVL